MNHSYLSNAFGTRHPIVNAPMAGAAGGHLAAAVSAAGGLGMVGVGASATKEWIDRHIGTAAAAGPAWGAGVMAWALQDSLDPLHHILQYRPSLVSVSFGDPGTALAMVRQSGAKTAVQIGNQADLQQALDYEVDVIVVRGAEAGGHGRNDAGTLPLLQLALEATSTPVLAAGGIATARGVAAALAAGAAGVWVGTRFTTAAESVMSGPFKDRIGAAGVDDTVYSRAFDLAQQLNWPPQFGGRALSNAFTSQWAGREDELEEKIRQGSGITEQMRAARADDNADTAPVYAGQAAALTGGGQTARDIVDELAGYRAHLKDAAAWL
ncbi:NAD(P)H-dependent flavin oxidoreductase [Arthrobacter castelli]|uniref:NAD(P)H-dependent flavin oxidoreductase n=1 Tax=Arthrobacter castelli TaxID=271431 RepID=UPI0004209DBB|nr:nitronate monooxygenase [Arthrobacter castelli]